METISPPVRRICPCEVKKPEPILPMTQCDFFTKLLSKPLKQPKIEAQESRLTLRSSFFDDLWPLILQENRCDIHSKNTSEFFVPLRRFDALWAHTYLAERNFGDYSEPTEIVCSRKQHHIRQHFKNFSTKAKIAKRFLQKTISEESQKPIRFQASAICTVEEQIRKQNNAQLRRQKLAYDYVNREFPWYIRRPLYTTYKITSITDEAQDARIIENMQFNILRNIFIFTCKLLFIDVGSNIPINSLKKWYKFCRYVHIIMIVRDEELCSQLDHSSASVSAVYLEEFYEITWQEELESSLLTALRHARINKLFEDCVQPIIFVFSKKRNMKYLDHFCVLRRNYE